MADIRYTKNGEWVRFDGSLYFVGISSSSAQDLGDVTFVDLPRVGAALVAGQPVCGLEAVKAAADFYAPIHGRVARVNERLNSEPQLVSQAPETEGWILALDEVSWEEFQGLLDGQAWSAWESGT